MIWDLFITFFKIGAFTFGGGYAMIPIIQHEVVEKKKWINDDEFMDALAAVQVSPGVMVVNTSIYVGYRVKGLLGAMASLLGTVLPSFITILTIAMFFYKYKDNAIIVRLFLGVRPAIVALILSAVYTLMQRSKIEYSKLIWSFITLILLAVFRLNPILIVIGAGISSVIYNKFVKTTP